MMRVRCGAYRIGLDTSMKRNQQCLRGQEPCILTAAAQILNVTLIGHIDLVSAAYRIWFNLIAQHPH
ncbi:hypothetical protein CBOM_08081 [Ceraceosorus bombacis]|uniref:Uncharacterized protein n=1 Tax=Ceraceosorus bombacis TaxID=401625 RepID=A0A0P1BSJ1_9BASI|nr:hypothetical protein CBOM_08081 [Ceraceosorus bombacis]